jgi:putative transposase
MILGELDQAVALGATLERACEVLGVSVRTVQRWREQGEDGGGDRRRGPEQAPHNKLPPEVEAEIIAIATSPEYCDQSPRQIVPHLADHKRIYLASESSFYRLLAKHGLNKHRGPKRAPAPRPRALTATGPGQVYSWDITYLRTRTKGQFYYLYMVVDVWSRMIVASEVHEVEKDQLAMSMVEKACAEGRISGMSWLHSDNGAPMRSRHMLATLQKLGVHCSFSRPRVSDDNPFSESLFSTLKHRPNYPRSFPSLSAARMWVDDFVHWYNTKHLHSGIGFVTPYSRHHGEHKAILQRRRAVYEAARQRHPERWSLGCRAWNEYPVVCLNPERNRISPAAIH